ncbi:MAG TPA: VOC family protein [Bdellovibrionales bacterium]|nr:VOC family protein [Bdellovibrionales bacterium]
MAIKKFGALVLFTPRLDRTVQFYQTAGVSLEDERHEDGPKHFACELGPVHFAIYESPAGEAQGLRAGGSSLLGFEVENLERTLSALRAIGTRVAEEPDDRPWGRRAIVLDPDGRPMELWQPKG